MARTLALAWDMCKCGSGSKRFDCSHRIEEERAHTLPFHLVVWNVQCWVDLGASHLFEWCRETISSSRYINWFTPLWLQCYRFFFFLLFYLSCWFFCCCCTCFIFLQLLLLLPLTLSYMSLLLMFFFFSNLFPLFIFCNDLRTFLFLFGFCCFGWCALCALRCCSFFALFIFIWFVVVVISYKHPYRAVLLWIVQFVRASPSTPKLVSLLEQNVTSIKHTENDFLFRYSFHFIHYIRARTDMIRWHLLLLLPLSRCLFLFSKYTPISQLFRTVNAESPNTQFHPVTLESLYLYLLLVCLYVYILDFHTASYMRFFPSSRLLRRNDSVCRYSELSAPLMFPHNLDSCIQATHLPRTLNPSIHVAIPDRFPMRAL